jgi:putative PIN family toxin of toxin-antitoxin system
MKVVLDTNVLLVIVPIFSPYTQVYNDFKKGRFIIAVSSEILLEYEEQLKSRYKIDSVDIELKELLESKNVDFVSPDFNWNFITADADDNKFVDCAIAANADYIITHDKHFDVLQTIPFPRVNILTLHQFIQLLNNP